MRIGGGAEVEGVIGGGEAPASTREQEAEANVRILLYDRKLEFQRSTVSTDV